MTKRWLTLTGALLLVGTAAQAQVATSDQRIPIHKDVQMTSSGDVEMTPSADSASMAAARAAGEWYRPTSVACRNMDLGEAARVRMDTDMYDSTTMITPASAKRAALCAVPGQITSGEMEMSGNRTEYEITIIPNGKKTYTKVNVDAQTGAVLDTKQFGGLRGLTGWVRESFEHKKHTP